MPRQVLGRKEVYNGGDELTGGLQTTLLFLSPQKRRHVLNQPLNYRLRYPPYRSKDSSDPIRLARVTLSLFLWFVQVYPLLARPAP